MAGNRSVKRSVEILELVSKNKSVTLNEVISVLGIPRTSAYDILRELVECKMLVEKRGEVNKYKIGLKAFQIGNEYINNTDLITVAKPVIREMADSLSKTAFIAVLDKGYVSYLYKYEPETSIITTSNIGTKNPIHCTSLGKAILSGMSRERVEEELKYCEFEKYTEKTHVNKESLLKDLESIKKRGYAVDHNEIEDHTLCIGAPIFDHNNEVIAGLSISGFSSLDRDVEYEGEQIRSTAQKISKLLGYKSVH